MKKQTESISVRVESDIKQQFFLLLDKQQKTFSKWLRAQIEKELKKIKQ